jgi:hypothetical protein
MFQFIYSTACSLVFVCRHSFLPTTIYMSWCRSNIYYPFFSQWEETNLKKDDSFQIHCRLKAYFIIQFYRKFFFSIHGNATPSPTMQIHILKGGKRDKQAQFICDFLSIFYVCLLPLISSNAIYQNGYFLTKFTMCIWDM